MFFSSIKLDMSLVKRLTSMSELRGPLRPSGYFVLFFLLLFPLWGSRELTSSIDYTNFQSLVFSTLSLHLFKTNATSITNTVQLCPRLVYTCLSLYTLFHLVVWLFLSDYPSTSSIQPLWNAIYQLDRETDQYRLRERWTRNYPRANFSEPRRVFVQKISINSTSGNNIFNRKKPNRKIITKIFSFLENLQIFIKIFLNYEERQLLINDYE